MCVNLKGNHKLLVTIVNKGMASKIVKASKEAGAEGGTIIMGRGTGIHEINKLFSIPVDPEKEVIFTLLPEEQLEQVMRAVIAVSKLDQPGRGIAFVLDVSKIIGCVHKLKSV